MINPIDLVYAFYGDEAPEVLTEIFDEMEANAAKYPWFVRWSYTRHLRRMRMAIEGMRA